MIPEKRSKTVFDFLVVLIYSFQIPFSFVFMEVNSFIEAVTAQVYTNKFVTFASLHFFMSGRPQFTV